ncbi:unnamed protein product [Rotaria sp. Silwood2]|nr:unnamed protein product [Rotaria sp. Silwood2]CAF4566282.1 unnamed protein product [Rotaria sp. Silwood2]
MKWKFFFRRIFFGGIFLFLIYIIIFHRRSLRVFLTESNINELISENSLNHTIHQRIPRIIHQTWKTHHIPINWNATVQSIHQYNDNKFEYRLWTDNDMHKFLRQEYSYFYEHTFLKYSLDIQRVDAFRYFILYRFGGIYIDMDNGCRQSFDSLLYVLEALDPHSNHLAAFPRTSPIGISNGFMITTKGHPLFKILISRLPLFNHNYLINYLTVMVSAGPSYLSINEFYFDTSYYQATIRIIDEIVYSSIYTWHTPGNSWHGRDAKMLLRIYHAWRNSYPEILYRILLIIGFIILFLLYLCYCRHEKRNFLSICYFIRKINLCRNFHYFKIKSIRI